MHDQKRRFRPRSQRNNFRPRNNPSSNNHFNSNGNGNGNIGRNNGSMTNPYNVEKISQKFQQLAKDALALGDTVVYENYLQHAEHYIRRLAELNLNIKSHKQNLDNKTLKDEANELSASIVEKN